jgi:hypothetical protein
MVPVQHAYMQYVTIESARGWSIRQTTCGKMVVEVRTRSTGVTALVSATVARYGARSSQIWKYLQINTWTARQPHGWDRECLTTLPRNPKGFGNGKEYILLTFITTAIEKQYSVPQPHGVDVTYHPWGWHILHNVEQPHGVDRKCQSHGSWHCGNASTLWVVAVNVLIVLLHSCRSAFSHYSVIKSDILLSTFTQARSAKQ